MEKSGLSVHPLGIKIMRGIYLFTIVLDLIDHSESLRAELMVCLSEISRLMMYLASWPHRQMLVHTVIGVLVTSVTVGRLQTGQITTY